ncbi:Major royal jelly protein 1 [Bienertia sinuspersici]
MASYFSIDIAKTTTSTFINLANRPTLLNPIRKPRFSFSPFHHKPYHSSINSLSFNRSSSKTFNFTPKFRKFSVAASSSTAAETTDDVITKIPPDDRIPATIITGFLGSGKCIGRK